MMEDQVIRQPIFQGSPIFMESIDSINPILVGIAGGSASGKTTLCNRIISELGERNCLMVSLDSFYLGVDPNKAKNYDFDHPDALDWDLCLSVLQKLLAKEESEIPIYNFATHSREKEWIKLKPGHLILFEGILALHDPRIVQLMNFRIFVQCDDDVRLYRRLLRDVKERGRTVEGVLYQYNTFVKPAFTDFIKPSMKWANIIVPGNSDNSVAVNFVVENLRSHVYTIEGLKSNKNKSVDLMSMLDSCWQNTVADQGAEMDALFKYQRVLLPTDENVRAECLNIFSLLSRKFSKTLYSICMSRFVTYGIKMMVKFRPRDVHWYLLIHYSTDIKELPDKLEENAIVGIIVPIWDDSADKEIQKKVETLSSKGGNIEIFIFAVFADMDRMVDLTTSQKNIYVINNLCVLDIDPLVEVLKSHCITEDYDLNGDMILIDSLMDTCLREIKRHSTLLTAHEQPQ